MLEAAIRGGRVRGQVGSLSCSSTGCEPAAPAVVTVRLPSALRSYAGGAERLDVGPGTVAEVLDQACRLHPGLRPRLLDEAGCHLPHLSVFVGEQRVDRAGASRFDVARGHEVVVLVAVAGGAHDVRMKGFRERASVEEALAAALDGLEPLGAETVPSGDAAGRVLAAPVVSEAPVPGFRRATMDGFAVRAADTYGATAYDPIRLRLEGASMPGKPAPAGPGPGGAVRIMTGAEVPGDADSVLRAEDAAETGDVVEVRAPAGPGRNVGRVGEDVAAGAVVLEAGRRLLPQDLGLLAAVGVAAVPVQRRPRVRIIVSGDELVPPGERPEGPRIADSNSPMLAALVARDGGVVAEVLRLPDGRLPMQEALARRGAEVVITSGAASVGLEDHTPVLVAEMGDLAVHGVAMRPSSPTGVGRIEGRPVLLLPGNPVSCLVAYDFFAGPVIRVMAGGSARWPYRSVRLPLAARISSQIGRTDVARVGVSGGVVTPLAIGGASVLTSVTRADGFVVVPSGSEGFPEGGEVEVFLYGEGP